MVTISAKRVSKNKRGHGGAIAIVLVVVLIVLAYIVCCVLASGSTFLKNVRVGGVDIGGMTYEQGRQTVYGTLQADGGELVKRVEFPDYTLEIPVSELGSSDLNSCIERAYAYGHDSFIKGGVCYIASLLVGKEFYSIEAADEDVVRRYVDEAVQAVSGGYQDYSVSVDAESGTMTIVKGVSQLEVDGQALAQQVIDELNKSDFTPVVCEAKVVKEAALDLDALYNQIFRKAEDAYYDDDYNVVDEVVGLSFDVSAAEKTLDEATPGETVVIPLELKVPAVTGESLREMLFSDVLSEYSTYVTNNSNRNNNISLACQACDGLILKPGEEFSYNNVVGERTTARGYKMAGAYVNGEVVDEVGGGICQVSSTIYMATLLANLEVTSRTNHMFVVSYVPLGMDATVNWGTCDYKFKNNTDHPIKLEAYLEDGAVTVRIYGTNEDGTTVKMSYEVLATYPYQTVEKEDSSIAEGQTKVKTTGSTGYKVRTYRHVYDKDGNEISGDVEAVSTYTKRDKVVLIPPKKEEAPPEEIPPEAETPDTPEVPADNPDYVIEGTIS